MFINPSRPIVFVTSDVFFPKIKSTLFNTVNVHAGNDELVRVVTVKTSNGTYKRPTTKIALLLPSQN